MSYDTEEGWLPRVSYPDLAGRVVLVTGAARGIGFAIARELAQHGMQVTAIDQDGPALGRAGMVLREGGTVETRVADVGDESQVAVVIGEIVERCGRIDALVNNAGIAEPHNGPVEALALDEWERRIRTNLTGAFLCTRYAVPYLHKSEGAIVNITSTRAHQSEPHTEAYSASKGGLSALTHALAISLGPAVRVNAVSPGWIDTAGEWDRLRALDHEQHPVGRIGHPRDVAGLAAWLLSDAAGFVTGQEFTMDGGMGRRMIFAV